MNCVFVCTVCKLSRRRALLKFALNNRQSAFLQRDLCSMFVLVTHVKFCSLWRHQFTVSEMEAIPASMLFVLLVNLIFLNESF